jgi:hypothetical protein
MTAPAILISQLTKDYGGGRGLFQLDLQVDIAYSARPVTAKDVRRAGADHHVLKTAPLASLRQTITRLVSWHLGRPRHRPNLAGT